MLRVVADIGCRAYPFDAKWESASRRDRKLSLTRIFVVGIGMNNMTLQQDSHAHALGPEREDERQRRDAPAAVAMRIKQ